jgi:heme-degrading monooxygenase HmoA
MIIRLWHGYTRLQDADAYDQMLKNKILPGLHRVNGYKGCYLLRKNGGAEVEFITLTLWESMEAVRQFAGANYTKAVIAPDAEKLLTRFDEHSMHYEATWVP